MTLYALGYTDPAGRTWFLARSAGVGNLLRTDQPLLARAWKHQAEPGMWLASLPPAVLAQLGGLDLYVYLLEATAGEPIGDRIPLSAEGVVPMARQARAKKGEKPMPLFT